MTMKPESKCPTTNSKRYGSVGTKYIRPGTTRSRLANATDLPPQLSSLFLNNPLREQHGPADDTVGCLQVFTRPDCCLPALLFSREAHSGRKGAPERCSILRRKARSEAMQSSQGNYCLVTSSDSGCSHGRYLRLGQ